MEAIITSLLLLVLGAQGAMWYKIGRVEQQVKNHLTRNREEP